MRTILKEEILDNLKYYRRLFLLSEVANLPVDAIVERVATGGFSAPAQVRADLRRLKATVEQGRLPEECEQEFNEIIDMRKQLERVSGSRVSADPRREGLSSGQRELVESRVASSLNIDQEVGFAADEATEWFYRRVYTAEIDADSA